MWFAFCFVFYWGGGLRATWYYCKCCKFWHILDPCRGLGDKIPAATDKSSLNFTVNRSVTCDSDNVLRNDHLLVFPLSKYVWHTMPSIGQKWPSFNCNCDVSIWVKHSRVRKKPLRNTNWQLWLQTLRY